MTVSLRLQAVLEAMSEAGALLLKEAYPHKYPYDWRTKKPTIFRATDQVSLPCNRLLLIIVCQLSIIDYEMK
jgi:isoleucyl-tRNA synthetase